MTRRTLFIFATLLLLWTIANAANHAASTVSLHLFFGGLYVTYVAVALPSGAGLCAAILAGAVCDAHTPAPFGLQAFLFAAAQMIIVQMKGRLPHDETLGRIAIALIANLGLFLALCFWFLHRAPSPAAFWSRSLVDLLASQAALLLIAPWFFALQERSLAYARGHA